MIGDPCQFEFSSADATTAAVLTIRKAGQSTVHSLTSTQRVVICSLTAFLVSGAGLVDIFSDANSDGVVDVNERMVVLGTGVNNVDFNGPDGGTAGARGLVPKVKAAAAGQVSIAGVGYIIDG